MIRVACLNLAAHLNTNTEIRKMVTNEANRDSFCNKISRGLGIPPAVRNERKPFYKIEFWLSEVKNSFANPFMRNWTQITSHMTAQHSDWYFHADSNKVMINFTFPRTVSYTKVPSVMLLSGRQLPLWCLFRRDIREKVFMQTSHLYFLTSACVCRCARRLLRSAKGLIHWGHWNGFSPEWVRIWPVKPLGCWVLNLIINSAQPEQSFCLGPSFFIISHWTSCKRCLYRHDASQDRLDRSSWVVAYH